MIEVKALSLAYGKKTVLSDVSLKIPAGSICSIIGANGCGKSTFLKALARRLTPRNGDILLGGVPLKEYSLPDLALKMAFVPQFFQIPAEITVEELVALGRFPHRSFRLTKEDRDAVENAIVSTGVARLRHQRVSALSGGERQKARIAMALAQDAKVLLLDEPVSFLDVGSQFEVVSLLRKLNEEKNTTVVMVLHDVNLAARYSDLIFAFCNGRLYRSGTPREIIDENLLRSVFNVDAEVISGNEELPFCRIKGVSGTL